MGYFKPFGPEIQRGQRFGANPGWGPNPPGGHNGDDYLSQVGVPVHAAGDGVVIFAGQFDSTYADNFGWNLNFGGNMVVLNLDGADGPYVEYGHMDELHVSTGQRVTACQVIGTSGKTDGNTGVITGPHLHVGCLPPNFNLNTNTYGRVNPDLYLTDYPDAGTLTLQSDTITPLEDDLSAADVDAIITETNKQKEDLKGQLFEKLDAAVLNLRQNIADTAGVDRQYLTDRIKEQSPADIAVQINAAGVATQVRDELIKLIGGAK